MARSIIGASGLALLSNSVTSNMFAAGGAQALGTEATAQMRFPYAGKISKLTVVLRANATTGTSTTVRLRKNGSNGNSVVTCTIGATDLLFQDLVNEDDIAAGDLVNFQLTTGSAVSGALGVSAICFLFTPTDSSISTTIMANTAILTVTNLNTSTTRYNIPTGRNWSDITSLGSISLPVLTDGVVENFGLYSNTGGRSLTQRMFKNASDDSIDRATLAQDVTGIADYTSNPITVDDDDVLAYRLVWGASGTTRNIYSQWSWLKTTNQRSMLMVGDGSAHFHTFTTTKYFTPIGYLANAATNTTEEAKISIPLLGNFRLSKLSIVVTANTIDSGTSLVKVRKNGSDGNQQISITSGQTGLRQDLSNTDTFGADDRLSLSVATSGSSGSLQYTGIVLSVLDLDYHIEMDVTDTIVLTNKFIDKA